MWLSDSVGKEWQEESLPEKVEASTRPGFVLPLWRPWAPAFPLRSGYPFCASCLQTRLKADGSHCCWLREPVMISRYRTSWILTQVDKNFLNFINRPFLFLLPLFPLIEVGKNFEVTLKFCAFVRMTGTIGQRRPCRWETPLGTGRLSCLSVIEKFSMWAPPMWAERGAVHG